MLDKRTGKMKKLQLDGVSKQRLNEIHVTKENWFIWGTSVEWLIMMKCRIHWL